MRHALSLALLACLTAQFAAGEPTTTDELHRLVDDGQFAPALQRITAALALKGVAAKSVDRFELLMLKGECHLRTKAVALAAESYANAQKAATDDRQRALAAAHVALLKASKAFAYAPKAAPTAKPAGDKGKPAPIDTLDPASRKLAFAAMLVDEIAVAEPKLKAARAAKSLPPIAEAAPVLDGLAGLELGATGDAKRIDGVRKELAEQTKRVLADALRQLNKRLGEIDKSANTFVEFYEETFLPGPTGFLQPRKQRAYKKKGLSDADTNELQQTNATVDKLPPALAELATALHQGDDAFATPADDAARIRKEVDRLLDTDYLKVYRELPKK